MCLLGLILFLIGSTIVISLIPIYLPTRYLSTSFSTISNPQNIILRLSPNNAVLLGTILDSSNLNIVQNQVGIHM
jgi:hypothetical protein